MRARIDEIRRVLQNEDTDPRQLRSYVDVLLAEVDRLRDIAGTERPAIQEPYQAMPDQDGAWWITRYKRVTDCPRCGRMVADAPAVMRYRENLDIAGTMQRERPDWVNLGWVVWFQCSACPYSSSGRSHEAVDNERVRRWGEELGGWSRMS